MTAAGKVAALQTVPPCGIIEVDCDHPDALIVRAWNKRQETIAAIEARGRMYDAEDHSPEELALYDVLENGIPQMEASTPLGALPKLWIAMHHAGAVINSEEMRAQSDAINRADFNEVATFKNELDWDEQVIFAVIGDILNAARFERVYPRKVDA